MKLRHVMPFMMLVAWQVAPSPDSLPRPSRLRLWLGGGTSSYDYAYMGIGGGGCINPDAGCDCTLAPTHPQRYEEAQKTVAAGIQVDAWPKEATRLSAALGRATADGYGTAVFAAALAAWEGPRLGVGAGWSAGPERVAYDGLSAYLRLGPADGAHLRAELRTPTSTPGATGWARAGVAYNLRGRRPGPEILLGVSAAAAGPDTTYPSQPGPDVRRVTRPAFFADLTLPLGPQDEFFVRGHFGKGTRGLGVGAALRLGR